MRTPIPYLAPVVAVALLAAAWLGGCSDNPAEPILLDSLPAGLIVSDPVPAGSLMALGARAASAPSANAEDSLVYVSLPPGTVEAGRQATLRRVGDAATLTARMLDGGFDPVPVAAGVNDSIEVLVTDARDATVGVFGLAVARLRPPIVVRTDPPRKKTDVPLNSAIVVVFSEPVAGSTLTSSSVRLFRGTTAVAATVRLLGGSATAAVLTPAAQLAGNTEYRLVATRAVRDLSGDPLAAELTTEFTTGTTVLGPVNSVQLVPDSIVEIGVGSQFQLTVIPRDAQGNVLVGRPTLWSSADPLVASVSASGLVTGMSEGTTNVFAEVAGQQSWVTVSVMAGLIPVASVSVLPESTRITVNATLQLVATVRDTAGNLVTRRPMAWSSSDPAVATVTPNFSRGAIVTGVGVGIARISAMAEGRSDTAIVAVGPPGQIVGLVLSLDSFTVVLQATARLKAFGQDDQGFLNLIDSTQVVWASSDSAIASVTNGLVTGLQAGSATLTGTWSGHQATARVTVVALSFTSISASGWHACGITTDSAAFCWGNNDYGQLGIGSIEPANTGEFIYSVWVPTAVVGGHKFIAISAGGGTCGLAVGGTVYCWGGAGLSGARTPVAVPGGRTFTALSVGGGFVCALDADSLAYCWGVNYLGQLGTGDLTASTTPRPVADGHKFTSISAGGSHACGVTAAGEAYCWGDNSSGQLGNTTPCRTPVPCVGVLPVMGGTTFAAISAAETHTCALDTNGAVFCWGISNWHQTGGSPTPAPVLPAVAFTSISSTANAVSTCGLDQNGTIQCWVDWGAPSSWTPWTVPGGPFAVLSKGYRQGCAVTAEQVGYCWGVNQHGQLGDGTTTDSSVPVKVLGQP